MLSWWHKIALVRKARVSAFWSSHTICIEQAVPADGAHVDIIKIQRHHDRDDKNVILDDFTNYTFDSVCTPSWINHMKLRGTVIGNKLIRARFIVNNSHCTLPYLHIVRSGTVTIRNSRTHKPQK